MKMGEYFVTKFIELGILKFGHYLMKQGVYSPIYVDLRSIISYPQFIKKISQEIWSKKLEVGIEADIICGVPYTALPIATAIEILYDVPMVLKRKEVKTYGTKKILEGNFKRGQKCLIIEDVVASGGSIAETAEILRAEGLIVTDCIAVLDRNQGGPKNLQKNGITQHSVLELKSVLYEVLKLNLVSEDLVRKSLRYLENTSFSNVIHAAGGTVINLPFAYRSALCSHPVLKRLFNIINQKKTNLCVAVDVTKASELLQLAEDLGPHICLLKTHIDIIESFSEHVSQSLRQIADNHNFMIFEDRKFADIGCTVQMQYKGGIYKIHDWADIVTAHSIPGDCVIDGIKTSCEGKACVLVAQMSSKGAINIPTYDERTVKIAKNHKDFVIGFISQNQVTDSNDFIHMCPGISLDISDDSLGQQYKTPETAIKKHGASIIIVGRGITKSVNVIKSAIKYKNKAYQAYMETVVESEVNEH